jgi:hypothetical protein
MKTNDRGESCDDIRIMARVVGFYTEVNNWNKGKKEEFRMRKTFDLSKVNLEENDDEKEINDKKSLFEVGC